VSSDTTRVRRTENLLGMLSVDPKKEVPTAGCPSCKAPLICTIAFSGAEFYCLECGRTCGWLDPYRLFGQKVVDRQAALQAEWDEHAGDQLLGNFWRDGCAECATHEGYHSQHATDEERQADRDARSWLAERAGR